MERATGFEVLFEKLQEASAQDSFCIEHEDFHSRISLRAPEIEELDAIANLRRIVLEVSEPHVQLFTTR